MENTFQLTSDFIKLDALLKATGAARSGGDAKGMIQAGLVTVNGDQETRRGRKIRRGDVVHVAADPAARIVVH